MLFRNVPLVGREAELDHVIKTLSESPTASVVIAGKAGVGKSRLAAEAADLVAAEGRTVAHVIATLGASGIPFGAFSSLLPDIVSLTEHPVELMHAFCEAIACRADGGAPILVVLDDAQFLDPSSAALVHELAVTRSCALLVTLRTQEVTPEPITSLWKEGLAQRVEIHALSRRETDALVVSYLGAPVAGSALRWLWDVSAGNPLFVRELLIGAEESGAAYAREGIWFLRLPLPAPSRLADLIASRLARVGAKTSDVMDLLAIGEPLGFAELVQIAGPDAVEEAEDRGLIVVVDDLGRAQVRLSHPLYREVLQHRMPRTRLRRLSSALAEAVEGRGALRRDDIMRVARWRLDSGSVGNPVLLERAAREARAAHDAELAARFARAALHSGAGVAAGLVLGETEFAAGRHEEAEKLFVTLMQRCRTDEETAMIASARAYNLGVLMGDEVAARVVTEDALSTVVTPEARDRLLVRQATSDLYAGRLRHTLSETDELLTSPDVVTMRRARHLRSIALALLGRTDEAVSTAYKALEQQRASSIQHVEGAMPDFQPPEADLIGSVLGHGIGGRLGAAEADARIGCNVGLDLHDQEMTATFSMLLGWVLVERGLVVEAAKSFREAAGINREISDLPTLRWCLGGVMLAEAMAGDRDAAAAARAELSTLPDHWFVALAPAMIDRGHAWVLIASGHVTAARKQLREAAQRTRDSEHFGWEASLLHDLVRLGEAKTVVARLADLAGILDGEMAPAYVAHAAARAAGDASQIEAAAIDFEKIGAMMLAAEAMQAAASRSAAEGMQRRVAALGREAKRLYRLCGVDRSPLAVEADGAVPLTKRELEIALLAGPGTSSKAIAEQLSLSVRTVDNHLLRIYMKLGVSGRDGLAAALGSRP